LVENAVRTYFRDANIRALNACLEGETSAEGLIRLGNVLSRKADVVVVGFGMNDWRSGTDPHLLGQNLTRIVEALSAEGARVILSTIPPVYRSDEKEAVGRLAAYNAAICQTAEDLRIRLADSYGEWHRKIRPLWLGLADPIHPNARGKAAIVDAVLTAVARKQTTVLWSFDGAAVPCNYNCPYCYDQQLPSRSHKYEGPAEKWHAAFKAAFGNQPLVFYISYGEPTLGKSFYQLPDMIAAEPQWAMMMTTNLSQPVEPLLRTQLAQEGRLNINASFHPTQTDINPFLSKLRRLRDGGIECPVIYVMYPPLMKAFEDYFPVFDRHGFLVHVRAFEGSYGGRAYPEGYREDERRRVAAYADSGTIKYMLNRPPYWEVGKRAFHGMHYVYVTAKGDAMTQFFGDSEFTPSAYHYGRRLGNVLDGTLKLDTVPRALTHTIERSVTDVSAVLETGYHELTGNFVLSFAQQGGVYQTDRGVHYSHLNTDFSDKRIRRSYNFPDAATSTRNSVRFLMHVLSLRSPFLRRHLLQKLRSRIQRRHSAREEKDR